MHQLQNTEHNVDVAECTCFPGETTATSTTTTATTTSASSTSASTTSFYSSTSSTTAAVIISHVSAGSARSSVIGIAVGVSVGGIVLLLLIALALLWRRKKLGVHEELAMEDFKFLKDVHVLNKLGSGSFGK